MVTFNCEVCNATVPKKNTEKHYYRCPDAYYTCIDCSKTFGDGVSYKQHTTCITEDEKYQKALYKGNGKKQKQQQKQQQVKLASPVVSEPKKEETTKIVKKKKNNVELKSGQNLYKVLKNIKDKDTRKTFLKSLVVDSNGHVVQQD